MKSRAPGAAVHVKPLQGRDQPSRRAGPSFHAAAEALERRITARRVSAHAR